MTEQPNPQQPTQAEVIAALVEACEAAVCQVDDAKVYIQLSDALSLAARSAAVPEVVEENPLLETVLDGLRGPRESFRETLTNKDNKLLARIVKCAEVRAQQTRRPVWSVIGEITGHGSGVSAAIYELYRDRPATLSALEQPNQTETRE